MKLVVLPGGGSPDDSVYGSVYRLLERGARQYGFDDVDLSLRWPGHANESGSDPGTRLTLDSALTVVRQYLASLESGGHEYALLGRSFGCFVALCYARDHVPRCLKRIVLWGPPSYWVSWRICNAELEQTMQVARTKGLYLDQSYWDSLNPIEVLLQEVFDYPIRIAAGTEDPYSPPAFLRYLRDLLDDKKHIDVPEPVPGARHEVTEQDHEAVRQRYLRALFE